MWRILLVRLGGSALLLWLILTFTFLLIHASPGEPVWLNSPNLHPSAEARLRDLYGLSRPLPQQYLHWMGAVLRGDWGVSFTTNKNAMSMVLEKAPATTVLAVAVLLAEHLLGFGFGVLAAIRQGSRLDRFLRAAALVANAFPYFVLGALLIEIFAVRWQVFPPQQMSSLGSENWPWYRRLLDLLLHLCLPTLTLACSRFGAVFRYVRNGLLDVLASDHLRAARALGIGERRLLWRFALPHTFTPLIQRLGVAFPMLLSGSMILEVIFGWPGLGWLFYNAFYQRDYPVLLATTGFSAVLVIVCNAAADLVTLAIDPRARRARD